MDLIINTRDDTKYAAFRGRRVWQLGLKCPLMNFFGTCILATRLLHSGAAGLRHSNLCPPPPPLFGDGPAFPRLCFRLFCFVWLMKKVHGVPGAGTLLAGSRDRGPGLKEGGSLARVQALQAASGMCRVSPSAAWLWVFLSGLLSCDDTHLDAAEVGTCAHLSS